MWAFEALCICTIKDKEEGPGKEGYYFFH